MTKERGVTLAVLAFNQEHTIAEAVHAAFWQDYNNLEIMLSDDCSGDRTYEVMARIAANYEGPHEVLLSRNTVNVGLVGHVNQVLEMASNELVVFNAGDDVSLPHRVTTLARAFYERDPRPLLVHSHAIPFTGDGSFSVMARSEGFQSQPILKIAKQMTFYVGPTAAVSKEMYRIYGPLDPSGLAEDTSLGFRAALLGRLASIEQPLLRYRLGEGLTSSTNRFTYAPLRVIISEKNDVYRVYVSTFIQRLRDLRRVGDVIGPTAFQSLLREINRQLLRAKIWQRSSASLARLSVDRSVSGVGKVRKLSVREGLLLVRYLVIWLRRAILFTFSRKPSRQGDSLVDSL